MSGLFGVASLHQDAQETCYFAMYALQHRGQVGCGMASNKNGYIDYHKGLGVVSQAFQRKHLKRLTSNLALSQLDNTQGHMDEETLGPILMGNRTGAFAIAFDGSLLNKKALCRDYRLPEELSDAELVARLIAQQHMEDLVIATKKVLPRLLGPYAFVLLTHDVLIGVRDPYGVKTLSVGKTETSHMIATETCAFESMGADTVREVAPGEMAIVSPGGYAFIPAIAQRDLKTCLFEVIYMSRPDSALFGTSVYSMQKQMGQRLAKIAPVEADCVIASPDSGNVVAMGYAEGAGIPLDIGIIKNRYIGRTFIEPDKDLRNQAVQIKLNVIKDTIDGKEIILVDDSIVRGTTMMRTVRMLRDAGARKIHVRIASPLVQYPCRIRVNLSIQENLLADRFSVEGIRKHIGADSLAFMDVETLLDAIPNREKFCTGCMTAHYPILEDLNGTEV